MYMYVLKCVMWSNIGLPIAQFKLCFSFYKWIQWNYYRLSDHEMWLKSGQCGSSPKGAQGYRPCPLKKCPFLHWLEHFSLSCVLAGVAVALGTFSVGPRGVLDANNWKLKGIILDCNCRRWEARESALTVPLVSMAAKWSCISCCWLRGHLIVMSCVLGVLPSPLRVDLLWGLEMDTYREAVGMEGNGCSVLSAQVLEADRPNSSISSLCDLGPALLMLGASFVLIWKMGTIRIPTS